MVATGKAVHLAWCDGLTPLGDAAATWTALAAGQRAVALAPVLGPDGGDEVPLALFSPMVERAPPRWLSVCDELWERVPTGDWGSERCPIFVTSSNFGVGNLLHFRQHGEAADLPWATGPEVVARLGERWRWGPHRLLLSHACVTAQLGLEQAARWLHAGWADKVLVFSFDFLSAFVAGGFHALKILNGRFPAPYEDGEIGSIALGDGVAGAVLTRDEGDWVLEQQETFNEMYHMTANKDDGSGFAALLEPLAAGLKGRPCWIKGHGTGTLEAGRLEAKAVAAAFPGAPLVSWKGSLGHTLGSCALVELAVALEAMRRGQVPGTVGTTGATFTDTVARESFAIDREAVAVLLSNAFGGAHAGCLLRHA